MSNNIVDFILSSVKDTMKAPKDSETVRNRIIWSDQTKTELLVMSVDNAHHLPNTIPAKKHYAVGVFFSSRDRDIGQVGVFPFSINLQFFNTVFALHYRVFCVAKIKSIIKQL